MVSEIKIPNKSLFKLDEVCSITGIKPYVIRFWESEFEQVAPLVSSTGQKLFEHKDIEAIALIKNLLFNEKMTIEKARAHIDGIYFSNKNEDMVESRDEKNSLQAEVKPKVSLQLKSSDLSKLTDTKELLKTLISRTDEIQSLYNWS